ncbi:MAG: FtsW/RodA/SpoVE family cell cycle protein, partial [Phycisphaeraceae bacterium]|nr:FtsW/RodA/SpoVE family cell cycle protein [Phycisphaeraceae bacterium]
WLCVLAGLALSLLGLDAIDIGERLAPGPGDPIGPIEQKQTIFLFVGLTAGGLVALPSYRFFAVLAWPAYIVAIALLIFLLLPFVPESIVKPRNGARGWIDLGFVDLQPAEFAKIAYVLAVAAYLRTRRSHRTFVGLVVPGIITFVPVALLTRQPDLGTAALFIPSLFAMLVIAGAKIRHLTLIVAIAMMAAPTVYPLLEPHQKQRIVGYIGQLRGDRSTASDINFQAFTAQALVGAGGLHGQPEPRARALVHYNRLPERHNDMIYSVIVCRHGQRGGVLALGLYAVWLLGAGLTAWMSRDGFARVLICGVMGFLAAQVFVNVGMNIGLLPIIGITLPFVSYGGSSMLTTWLMTGLVLNVGLHRAPSVRGRGSGYPDGDDE